jgi:hypothetical protein
MAFIAALPEIAEVAGVGAEAGAGAAEAGAGAAEAGAGASEAGGLSGAASSLRSGISGMARDFNDSQVGKFLGSSQGRMVTQGAQLAHQFDTQAQQQEQQTQQQEQGPVFGG